MPPRQEPQASLPGVLWPAMPEGSAATLLALLDQFEATQWLDPQALTRRQFAQLKPLLGHAHAHSPFWRDRLDAAGYRPGVEIDPDWWLQLPVLTRPDLQRLGDELFSDEVPDGHLPTEEIWSSGSTGTPVKALGSRVTQFIWAALALREHRWHQRDFKGKLAAIRLLKDDIANDPQGLTLPNWGPPVNLVYRSGPGAVLTITRPIDEQAEWLQRQRPDYLLTFPSNALALAEHCIEHGIRLPGLKEVRTLGEALPADLRARCREAWDVPVSDVYSAREAGYFALQCPGHSHYHVQAEAVLLEILREDGTPCGIGEPGRVVVTPLHNFASPLLRYEIGDIAEFGPPCACGRGLPVIQSVLGRVRHMLVLPDGRKFWPSLMGGYIRDIVPMRQYQLVQRAPDQLEARLVMDRPATPDEETAVTALIQERMDYPFQVRFSYPERIDRASSGKFEEFRSEI